ncbi:phosphopantetheine-binding [Actinosynnema mirum DSM 43827]|uniref:Phosphopantetheine-binding n=1 Tax=Actinosynnema mirum (strain ATCC 29888 / DSM 43827 / JCM 3225 / NBRC 14064 / NCIMB 13271 / NRRL B-12336 / IMRU 3971 / 101) TaxID=446462 RepID=C6WQA2_ACTMD|nr:phosphopantetheine-binding [Actinosynnema mirum DSM 43827]AXX30215.1 hypothetical protein APASM_2850 [Actinosynnema pretiosum subsp. pretiosum]
MVTEERFAEMFREAVVEVMGEGPPDGVGMDTPLADLHMDSLSQVEVISRLESETGVRVPNDRLTGISTPRDLLAVLQAG